jgi:hypothetical protein
MGQPPADGPAHLHRGEIADGKTLIGLMWLKERVGKGRIG